MTTSSGCKGQTTESDWLEKLLQPKSIDVLCREANVSNIEVFKPNHFYGNASVLKRYAGLPQEYPIFGIIEHGIYLYSDDFTAGGELSASLPVFLCTSKERSEIYQRLSGGKMAFPIGSAFLYAKALLQDRLPPVEKNGTLVLLSHSTHYITKVFDHAAYAETLAALPESFHPIVISAYWKDYLDGQYQPYIAKGFELVTAGHMEDPDFLCRFYMNCRRVRYACSNDAGSHLFFAVESGCSFFMLPGGDIQWKSDKKQFLASQSSHQIQAEKIQQIFSKPIEAQTLTQQGFVDAKIGKTHFKSQEELKQILLKAERIDKFQWRPIQTGLKTTYPRWYHHLPTFWQRKKLISKLATILGKTTLLQQ